MRCTARDPTPDSYTGFAQLADMPPFPDYTRQLEKIIAILDSRQTPEWIWLLLGWVLGIGSTIVVGWINGVRDRRRLQKMLYREMVNNYWQLRLLRERIINVSPGERLIKDEPSDVLEFGAYEFAKGKRDSFEALKEVGDIETVYDFVHKSESMSAQNQLTVIRLNPVLDVFEERVGTKFSQRLLLAVSSPLVRPSIEQIIRERKNA